MAETDQQRSEEDFLSLFSRNSDGLKSFVRMLVRNPHDCEDVWQSASLVLWKKFGSYDKERPFDKWARGVVVREVLSHRRGAAKRPTALSPESLEVVLVAFEDRVAGSGPYTTMQQALEKCIRALRVRSQQVVALRYFEDWSFGDIALEMGSSEVGVRKTLSRIRRQLAECVRRRVAATEGE